MFGGEDLCDPLKMWVVEDTIGGGYKAGGETGGICLEERRKM